MVTKKLAPGDAGPWVDESRGVYMSPMIINIAIDWGYVPSEDYQRIVTTAEKKAEAEDENISEMIDAAVARWEFINEEVDCATNWMNEHVAPKGFFFESDGDWGLFSALRNLTIADMPGMGPIYREDLLDYIREMHGDYPVGLVYQGNTFPFRSVWDDEGRKGIPEYVMIGQAGEDKEGIMIELLNETDQQTLPAAGRRLSGYPSAFQKFVIGARIQVCDLSGVVSGRTGIVVDRGEIKTDGRGIPTNIHGAYKPVDWSREVAIKYDNGEYDTLPKNRVDVLDAAGRQQLEPLYVTVNGVQFQILNHPEVRRLARNEVMQLTRTLYVYFGPLADRRELYRAAGYNVDRIDMAYPQRWVDAEPTVRARIASGDRPVWYYGGKKSVFGEPLWDGDMYRKLKEDILKALPAATPAKPMGIPVAGRQQRAKAGERRAEVIRATTWVQERGSFPFRVVLLRWVNADGSFREYSTHWQNQREEYSDDYYFGHYFPVPEGPASAETSLHYAGVDFARRFAEVKILHPEISEIPVVAGQVAVRQQVPERTLSFNVYLQGRMIDTVFYSKGDTITLEEVRRSLIDHDGYDPRIVVAKGR